jgi:hypothetical protein
MPMILLLLAAAVVAKFAWLLAAVAAAAVAGRLIGWWLARRADRAPPGVSVRPNCARGPIDNTRQCWPGTTWSAYAAPTLRRCNGT